MNNIVNLNQTTKQLALTALTCLHLIDLIQYVTKSKIISQSVHLWIKYENRTLWNFAKRTRIIAIKKSLKN